MAQVLRAGVVLELEISAFSATELSRMATACWAKGSGSLWPERAAKTGAQWAACCHWPANQFCRLP